jgi:hypothetical protein
MLNILYDILLYVISTLIISIFIKGIIIFLTSDYVIDVVNRLYGISNGKPLVEMKVKTFLRNILHKDLFI